MDIPARNKQFKKCLQFIYPEVELYGSLHRPKPVIQLEDGMYYVLPCYVHNGALILMDSVVDGNEIYRLRLQWELSDENRELLSKWKDMDKKLKRCYFIRLSEEEVYLNEAPAKDEITEIKDEPSFAFGKRKIFLNYKDAISELEKLQDLRDNLVIV